jgi:DNA-binding response OmpR family regulator
VASHGHCVNHIQRRKRARFFRVTQSVKRRGNVARAKVLVVDDEPSVVRLVTSILRKADYDVSSALGSAKALEIVAAEGPFDLVVSDVIMPGMCGPQMWTEIRDLSPTSAIMFMSGSARAEGLPEGVPLLGKPFSKCALLATVDAVLRGSAARRAELKVYRMCDGKDIPRGRGC